MSEDVEEDGGGRRPAEQLTTPVVEVCVVKRCLVQTLDSGLTDEERYKFLDYVDDCTDIASRIARRTSLAFLYYVVRRQEQGHTIPDFSKGTDGYWLQWMRTGLEEYDGAHPTLVLSAKNAAASSSLLHDTDAVDRLIFQEIDQLLGTTIGPGKRTIPKFFDRILGHLAIQFKTSVKNAMTVNFFVKLRRVCRNEVAAYDNDQGKKKADGAFSGFDLFQATVQGTTYDGVPVPEKHKSFVHDVREKLGLQGMPAMVVDETTSFDLPARFSVHWYLQQRLEVLQRRKLMLAPVNKVQRMHVRLDATHMGLIINDIIWSSVTEQLDKLKPEPLPKCPNKESHPDAAARKVALKIWKEDKIEYEKKYEAYQDAKVRAGASPLAEIRSSIVEDPETILVAKIPLPSIKRPANVAKKDTEWTNNILPELQRRRDDAVKARSKERMTEEYISAMKAYLKYEDDVRATATSFFINKKDRNPKLGWKPTGSVMTDGVSLCVTYERIVHKVNKTCKSEMDEFVKEKAAKREAKATAAALEPYDDYDSKANTCSGDALILGIDPGRVTIVTIVCIGANGKKKTWKLTRGQLLQESGILTQNKKQSLRYECLAEDFVSLTANGGSLRASSSDQIKSYIVAYKAFEEKWFTDVALKRRESRSKLQRFIGKQKVLASFFSKVRKEAEAVMKESKMKRIEVAYGACGPSMASTGKGELAVPVRGAYGACIKAFTKEREKDYSSPNRHVVTLVDESMTSQVSWESKVRFEKVYKVFVGEKEFLHHTTDKKGAPFVSDSENVQDVINRKAKMKIKACIRRGGKARDVPLAPIPGADAKEEASKNVRHINVRGLLFCPERRMYFSRDEQSAEAIAGLRIIEMMGKGRPSLFRRTNQRRPETTTLASSEERGDSNIGDSSVGGRMRSDRMARSKKQPYTCRKQAKNKILSRSLYLD